MTKKLEELFDVAPADELDITAQENTRVVVVKYSAMQAVCWTQH
jgi:hypothetical protein